MAYDAKDGYAVLFGGSNTSLFPFTDTWTYKSGAWSQIFPPTSPSARLLGILVYDPVDQYLVLFGGQDVLSSNFDSDTWTFSAGHWTNITSSVGPAGRALSDAAWDPVVQSVVMFGGANSTLILGDTWRFVGGTWTELFPLSPPSARAGSPMAFDVADNYLVLFGGVNGTADFSDTWRFTNGSWTQLFPSVAPSARAAFAMSYDPQLGTVLLFGGGVSNDTLFFGDTWTFRSGGWTQQFPTASPSARQFSQMVWDPADGYLLMTSGATSYPTPTQLVSETWAFVTGPTVAFSAPVGAVDVGQAVSFTASLSGGALPYNVSWSFGDGHVASGGSTTHVFQGPGAVQVNVTLKDRFGQLAAANHTFNISARPAVGLTVSPLTAVVGQNVTLSAAASGGSRPLSISWTLGDGRIESGPGPFTVRYTASGSFAINVTVTDAAGVQVSSQGTVTIQGVASGPAPSAPPPSFLTYGLVIGALVVVAAVAFLVGRRRRPPNAPTAGPAGTASPPPAAPPLTPPGGSG